VQISSRSYVVTKSKKTVAKSSTQGKTIKLSAGTYKVKTTAKYRIVTTEKTSSPGPMVWKEITNVSVDPVDLLVKRTSAAKKASNGGLPVVRFPAEFKSKSSTFKGFVEYPVMGDGHAEKVIVEADGVNPLNVWGGTNGESRATHQWVQGPKVHKTVKVYAYWKTIAETQTVKIAKYKPPYSPKAKHHDRRGVQEDHDRRAGPQDRGLQGPDGELQQDH
jgi:hypothetical protein